MQMGEDRDDWVDPNATSDEYKLIDRSDVDTGWWPSELAANAD